MIDINRAMKDVKSAQLRKTLDQIETQCQFKVGQPVTIKKQIGELKHSVDQKTRYRYVPGVIVDVIEVYRDGEAVELRVAPKLKSERIGNPIIRWWHKDNEISQVFVTNAVNI